MTDPIDPAAIETAVLRARWEKLQSEGEELRQQMAASVSSRDEEALAELNLRVQAHRARLHEFEAAAAAYRERFARELKL